MYRHDGIYCRRNGEKIPFLLTADDGKLIIKWDNPDGTVGYKRVPIRHNGEFVWKVTKTGVSCMSIGGMFDLFNNDEVPEYNAYANATFGYLTGIQ